MAGMKITESKYDDGKKDLILEALKDASTTEKGLYQLK